MLKIVDINGNAERNWVNSKNFYCRYRVHFHCLKSVRILSFSGPYFPTFGLKTERYGVSLLFSPNAGKYGPEKLRIRTLFTQCLLCNHCKQCLHMYNLNIQETSEIFIFE